MDLDAARPARPHGQHAAVPVHVGQLGQDAGGTTEASVLLVIPPEQIHIANFVLVNFGHSG